MNEQLSYITRMEQMMDEDAKDMLRRIWEPTVVATPLSDARRDLCVLPSGELRMYGYPYTEHAHTPEGPCVYLSSVDGGISWTKHYSKGQMNSCTYVEAGKVYLAPYESKTAFGVKRSLIGPDDPNPEIIIICKEEGTRHFDTFLPIKSEFSNRIWMTSQKFYVNSDGKNAHTAVFCYSDDFGKTWTKREIEEPEREEVIYPHKSLRWCYGSGVEPHAVEFSEGKMMMIIRTPLDFFYLSYSYDGGDSWSKAEPSTFYGTDTTAYLLRLSDGRVLAFWNNTKPLSQPNYKVERNRVSEWVSAGKGENAFTNRDAAHAAISSDGGKTFVGYRELILNPIRDRRDFRYFGGVKQTLDKSVHQFQALELPFGKVLVTAGQNAESRRAFIFDIGWLLENERSEDFVQNGISQLTTHTYAKSFSDHTADIAGNGHCSWNRAPSAYLLPDPDGSRAEVLSISKHHDERLYNDIGGAVWNFPCSKKGKVEIVIKIAEKSARISLSDRWYNTCDPHVAAFAPFTFDIEAEDVGDGYVTLSIEYDTELARAAVAINGEHLFALRMAHPVPTGISYLHMQCATDGDSEGFYIKSLKKTV